MKKIFITGTAGFIGFHLAKHLLELNFEVRGFDAFTDYYDVNLKRKRNEILHSFPNFSSCEGWLQNKDIFQTDCDKYNPNIIIHLAAQAGVRYSLHDPRSYLDSNILGTFNVLESAHRLNVDHLIIASTSSVYGANTDMPFGETQQTDTQLTFYAATKKAIESMAHSYSHLWGIPTTVLRFFTVYGPWGRPDLALFKFVKSILNEEPIEIYNHGKMSRDFTYIDDLVRSINLLMNKVPQKKCNTQELIKGDSLSPVAPFRIVNIGNSNRISLMEFIETVEIVLKKKAIRKYMDIQKGDVQETWSDTTLLKKLTNYQPNTDIRFGINEFVKWYKEYYKI